MQNPNEPLWGMLTTKAANKICNFYNLSEPRIEEECWVTTDTSNSTFPFKENRDEKEQILLNFWLVFQILKDYPTFFDDIEQPKKDTNPYHHIG